MSWLGALRVCNIRTLIRRRPYNSTVVVSSIDLVTSRRGSVLVRGEAKNGLYFFLLFGQVLPGFPVASAAAIILRAVSLEWHYLFRVTQLTRHVHRLFPPFSSVPVDFKLIDNSSAAAPETLSNPFNGALKFKPRLEVNMVQLPAQLARHLNGKLVSSALRRQLCRCDYFRIPFSAKSAWPYLIRMVRQVCTPRSLFISAAFGI